MRALGLAQPLTGQAPCCHLLPRPQRRPLGRQAVQHALAASSSSCSSGAPALTGSRREAPGCGGRRRGSLVVRADYYETLGVSKGADKKTIKTAYRCGSGPR